MRDPPQPAIAPAVRATAGPDYELAAALRTWQWYALWVMLFLGVGAGISIIAEAVPMAHELVGASDLQATALVGTIALFNGAGRLAWAALSDLVGRRTVFALMFVLQAGVFFALPMVARYDRLVVLACVSLFCYGGGFGTMPALVADYFGTRNVGRIYGLLLTAWSAGAVLGPVIVSHLRDATGEYTSGLHVIAVIMIAGSLVPIVLHAPRRRRARVAVGARAIA